jgi:hypothetical protein
MGSLAVISAVFLIDIFSYNMDISEGSLGGLTSSRGPVVKIIAKSLSQHDEKHVV